MNIREGVILWIHKASRQTRKQSALCYTKEESRNVKANPGLRDPHQGGNDTPKEGESGKPYSWTRQLEDDICGYLSK